MKYQDIFKRYEVKYLLSANEYKLLFNELKDYVVADQYGKSTISNIYFDTPDHRIIRASLEKPVYKEKLRLRCYGKALSDSMVFIELKKKYDGVVYKRRIIKSLVQAEAYLNHGHNINNETQIEKEIDWILNHYPNMHPAMFLSYDRIATVGKDDPNLRITLDSNILWRDDSLSLTSGVWGHQLLEQGQRLMEIKVPGAFPLWLTTLLGNHKLYPKSFSKYGNAYVSSLSAEQNKKGVIYCA